MFKPLVPLYLVYLLSIFVRLSANFMAFIIILFTLAPFKPLYQIGRIATSLYLAFITVKQIMKARFKAFIWELERQNPHLGENLISFFELNKVKNPYTEILKQRLINLLSKKLNLKINFASEFRVLSFSITFFLIMLLIFPEIYSGFNRVRLQEISPDFCITTTDSTRIFKAHRTLKFFVQERGKNEEFIKKDSILSISFKKPGTFYIIGKTKKSVTLPSIVKVVAKPQIDSFFISTSREIRKNPNWLAVPSGSKIELTIYSAGNVITLLTGKGKHIHAKSKLKAKLKIEHDTTITVAIENQYVTRKIKICEVQAVMNLPPRIEVEIPAHLYSYVPEDMKLEISGNTYDEDGLSAIYLIYTVRGLIRREKIPTKGEAYKTFSFHIDLEKTGMLPGDELTFYIISEDFEGYADSTELYHVVFPTLEEVYKEEASKIAEAAGSFQEGTKSFQSLKNRFENFGDSLKIGLKDKESLENITENFSEEIANITKEFENILESLEKAQKIAISPELLAKMQTIGQELYDIVRKEIPELEKEIREFKNLDYPDNLKKWEKIQEHADEILERLSYLEKLIEMAKKEMALKEMENRIDDLVEKRMELIRKSEKSSFSEIQSFEQEFEKELESTFQNFETSLKENNVDIDISKYSENIFNYQSKILKAASSKNRKSLEQAQNQQLEELKEFLTNFRNLKESTLNQEIAKLLEIIGSVRRALLATSLSLEKNINNPSYLSFVERSLERIKIKVKEAGPLILMASSRVPELLKMARDSLYLRPVFSLNAINSAIFDLFRIQAQARSRGQGSGDDMEAMKFLENLMKQQSQMIKETSGQIPLPLPLPQFQEQLLGKTSELKSKLMSMYMNAQNSEVREKIENALREIQKVEEKIRKGEIDTELVESQRKTLKHMLDAYGIYKREELAQKRYAEPARPYKPEIPEPKGLIDITKIKKAMEELRSVNNAERGKIREFYIKLLKNY